MHSRGNQESQVRYNTPTVAATAFAAELGYGLYGDSKMVGVAGWFGPGRALLDRFVTSSLNTYLDQGEKLTKWWIEYTCKLIWSTDSAQQVYVQVQSMPAARGPDQAWQRDDRSEPLSARELSRDLHGGKRFGVKFYLGPDTL